MKSQLAAWAAVVLLSRPIRAAVGIKDVMLTEDVRRALQATMCERRLDGLVCPLTTTTGDSVVYTVNCPRGATSTEDCLLPESRVCYQFNGIPCISSLLCTASGPIANDCSNIFAASTGSECSETDCAGECVQLAPTPVEYNTATRNNICMMLGFQSMVECEGPTCFETNRWWHVLSTGDEIEVQATRDTAVAPYETCDVEYNGQLCSCSVNCSPIGGIAPRISYDCGAYTDDACAAVDCEGNCVNSPGPPVQAPVAPPTPEAPVTPPVTAPVTAPITAPTLPDCNLSIRVFETAGQCNGDVTDPTNTGTLIPDGTCRDSGGSELLPGIYRAECTANGEIRFLESGCRSLDGCNADANARCVQDVNTASYLYSALPDPVFDVQSFDQQFLTCNTLSGTMGRTVTFVIQGVCSPDCSEPMPPVTAPMSPPVTAPVIVPVPAPVAAPTSPLGTLVDLVVNDPELATLETAVVTAELVEILSGSGPFTLFAPLDEAFAGVDPALLAQLLTPEFILHLQNILAYHVVEGAVLSTDLSNDLEVTMLNGETLTVQITDGTVFLTNSIMDAAAMVVDVDIEASNGFMHKIAGSVLLPSFLGRDLVDLLASDPNYSTLVTAVQTAGLEDALRTGTLTVLAPDNAAFDALPDGVLDDLLADPEALAQVLLYHVAEGVAPSVSLTSGLLPTLNGESLEVSVSDAGITFNGVPVVAPDGLARNGIAHGISEVLIPSMEPPAPSAPIPQPSAPIPQPSAPIPQPSAPVPQPSAPVPQPSAPVPQPSAPVPQPSRPPFNYPPGSDQCFLWSFQTDPNRRSRRIQFRSSDTK